MEVGEHTENLDHLQIFPDFAFLVPVSPLCFHKSWCSAGMCDSEGPLRFLCSCSELQTCAARLLIVPVFLCVELSVTFLASLTVCYLPWPQALCDVTLRLCLELEPLPFLTVPVAWAFSAFSSQSSQVCVLVLERVLAVMGHPALVRLPTRAGVEGRQGGDSWDQPQARRPESQLFYPKVQWSFWKKYFASFICLWLHPEMVVFDHFA